MRWRCLLAAVLSLVGCSEAQSGDSPSMESRLDSSGVEIVRHSDPFDAYPANHLEGPREVLEVGAPDSVSEPIGRVIAIRRLSRAAVVIADGLAMNVQVVTPTGRHVFGGLGDGPGEFRDITRLFVWVDSIGVFDQRLKRLTVATADGTVVRTLQIESRGREAPIDGLITDSGHTVALFRIPRERRPGRQRAELNLAILEDSGVWADLTTLLGEEIDLVQRGSGLRIRRPLLPQDSWVVAVGDHVLTVDSDGGGIRIRPLSTGGALTRVMRWQEARMPVTSGVIDDVVTQRTAHLEDDPRRRAQARLREQDVPPFLPTASELLADRSGFVWVKVFDWREGRPGKWVAFDMDGNASGVLNVPAGIEVHDITDGILTGVSRDAFDRETIVEYTIGESP
jgi:hypothetical protein